MGILGWGYQPEREQAHKVLHQDSFLEFSTVPVEAEQTENVCNCKKCKFSFTFNLVYNYLNC